MSIHLLYFRLAGAERFGRIHGERISRVAFSDLTRRFGALARDLLRQHSVLSAPVSPRPGVWAVPFELRRLEIEADEREQLESIAAAGSELARDAVADELGSAVALHARLDAGTLAVAAGGGPARWMRELAAFLRAAPPAPEGAPEEERAAVRAAIDGGLSLHLQKIVALGSGRTAAFEVLLRGPAGPLRDPERLLAAAARRGLREGLELAALDEAVKLARRLPRSLRLAVNLSPDLFAAPALRRVAEEDGLPGKLIFEITEHLPIPAPSRLRAELAPLRRRGALVALDDAGCGYLNMELVRALKPDIVKLCITLTRRIGAGPAVAALVRRTVSALRAAGASALAEGVETAEQARLARACGCSLAQGFRFERPRPAADALSEAARSSRRDNIVTARPWRRAAAFAKVRRRIIRSQGV